MKLRGKERESVICGTGGQALGSKGGKGLIQVNLFYVLFYSKKIW